ncbi:MAG TPA: cellulase family glycosylhydrolase [Marmoricola sp.]|nr:cellulase family glycosylhydrolase [Marmoricola sp.]
MRRRGWIAVAVLLAATLVTVGAVILVGGSGHHGSGRPVSRHRVAGTPGDRPTSSSSDALPAAEPVVKGNQIIDQRTGKTFVPRGVNWSSFEYACTQGWGYSTLDRLTQSDPDRSEALAIASWGANVVRLPVNEDCWLGTRGAPVSSATVRRTAAGYRASITGFIKALNDTGLVVILDLQSRKRPDSDAFGNVAMPDDESLDFWRSAAALYAGDPSIIFDGFNEPYSRYDPTSGTYALRLTWDCWRDGGCAAPVQDDRQEPLDGQTYTAQGMSAVVAAIRAAGARQPIILGGLDYANDLTGWLDHRPSDPQLIAGFHSYPFKDCRTITCWDTDLLPVLATVPVITSEVGDNSRSGNYVENYVKWANSHKIGWLAWVWEDTPSDPMALIQSDRLTATNPYGIRVRGLLEHS